VSIILSDVLTALAILPVPFIAIRANEFIEIAKERRGRELAVLHSLTGAVVIASYQLREPLPD
jgi:hypothetical protein